MAEITALLGMLNTMSPLGIIALLGVIIWMLVKGKTSTDAKVETIANNHLHGLPDITASLDRIEGLLQSMNESVIWIKARVNGGKH